MKIDQSTNLVSIIMPVKNAGQSVTRALESLGTQTYGNLEIIVVDYGSTDETTNKVQKYAAHDGRTKLFTSHEPSSRGQALNVGLDNATGEYVMFLDANDWYNPTTVEKMVSEMATHKTDMAICFMKVHGTRPKMSLPHSINKQDFLMGDAYTSTPRGTQSLWEFTSDALWDKIFRRSTLNTYAIRFSCAPSHNDSLLFYQYTLVSQNFCLIKERLYNYTDEGRGPSDSETGRWDGLCLIEDLFEFCDQNKFIDHAIVGLNSAISYHTRNMRKLFSRAQMRQIRRRLNHMFKGTPFVLMEHGENLVLFNKDQLWKDKAERKWHIKALSAIWQSQWWWPSVFQSTDKFVTRMEKK